MSLVESLQDWQDAVQYYNGGDFQKALEKFLGMPDPSAKITFNVGRTYMSLCDLQKSLQSFQLVIRKDEHLAIGHFMLGVVNLMCTRHADALINFNETFRNLRGSKFIDYKQLGMRYKLYKCEVLLNRAVCLSSLGYNESATEDLLVALQCKVETRHNIIDVSLENLQRGKGIEFLVMDSIFQPPKSKTANLEKINYLGKAQVVMDTYETMESPVVRDLVKAISTTPDSTRETYRVLYDFQGENAYEVSVTTGEIITVTEKADDGWYTMVAKDGKKTGLVPGSYLEKVKDEKPPKTSEKVTERQALLTDLRKKEARQSLRRVPPSSTSSVKSPRLPPKLEDPPAVTRTAKLGNTRPKTIAIESTSPKLPPSFRHTMCGDTKNNVVLPKFSRQRSIENLLGNSPGGSPPVEKKTPVQGERSDSDDDNEYIDIDGPMAEPYAIRDLISPAERATLNKTMPPTRPVPPSKSAPTLKPRLPLPITPPRSPRQNTVSILGSAFDQKRASFSPTPNKRPTKIPPKLPTSPIPSVKKPNGKSRNITVEFIVSTSLMVNPMTTPEEIQTSVKGLINGSNFNHLWCEKDGKRVRFQDQKPSNMLDFVKDGKLKLWCTP